MVDAASHAQPPPNGAASLAPLAPPKPPVGERAADLPRQLGRLTLLKPIARGGMGEVFLATSGGIEGAERPCVVKLIRREHVEDPSFLARFFDEARVQAQLDHPGVARVLEASTDPDGKPFVVVEYVEGRNLSEVRTRGSQLNAGFGWAEAVAVGVSLADALAHVHERTDAGGRPLEIVHRDLSPQNVMIAYGGDVKLIDFGTARGENRRCHTVSGVVLAKPGYVAPEVANDQPGGVAADLYALGIILWELVAGRRFLTGDPAAHVAAVAEGRRNPPPLATLVKAPPELDTVIARLTAPRIEDRFTSARDASTELVRVLKRAPSLANGDRGVRARIAHLMDRLYPAEPARSRGELARLIATARKTAPAQAAAAPAPSPLPAAVDESLFPGTRYRILRELGRGSMGVVYEAHHVDLGRVVALKVLPKERCQSPELEARFRKEARSIARLRHPNLVHLHDFGVASDGRPYYAMELLEGETLEQYLGREHGMDWREAARVGVETCAALEAAHGAGLVHRDIKPGNVFMTRDGRLKLLDFGVVQEARAPEARQEGEARALVGTVEYMAPEQAAGEVVDERADLYAVGAMLYELVTGRLPHVAGSAVALIDRKLRATPESPRERAPGRAIPRALDRTISRALSRFPTQRFQTATELRQALEAALAAPAAARSMRRRAAVLALVGLAALVGAVGVRSARSPEVRARAEKLIAPLVRAERDTALNTDGEDAPVAILYEAPAPRGTDPEAGGDESGDDVGSDREGSAAEAADPAPAGAKVDADAPSRAEDAPTPSSVEPSSDEPLVPEAELARAESWLRKGHELQALHAFRELGTRSSDPRVLRGWSQAAVKTKGWGEALRVAIRWAEGDPRPEAHLYLAKIQLSAGQRYGAVATLTRLLERHPEQREAQAMLDRVADRKIAAR